MPENTKTHPRTICIVVKSAKLVQRYFLRSGLVRHLLSQQTEVVFLVPVTETEFYEKEFGQHGVRVLGVPVFSLPRFYHAIVSLSRKSCQNASALRYLFFKRACRESSRGEMILDSVIGIAIGFLPAVSRAFQHIARWLLMRFLRIPELERVFDEEHPAVVFSPVLLDVSFDIPILITARRRGIRTIGAVRAWTDIGSGPFLLFHPDRLILQNEFLKTMVVRYDFFPKDRVRVIGFPYFDWFAKRELLAPREAFLRSLGISPEKRVILYAVNDDAVAGRDIGIAELFDDLSRSGKIPKDLLMLFRPHPYFRYRTLHDDIKRLEALHSVVLDPILYQDPKQMIDPEKDAEDFHHLMNSLFHSAMVLVSTGTIVLEALALDRPVIALGFDGKVKAPYWLSFRQLKKTHFHWPTVLKTGGIRNAESVEELARAICEYADDSQRDNDGRKKFRDLFVGPLDGMSTERLARELATIAHRSDVST